MQLLRWLLNIPWQLPSHLYESDESNGRQIMAQFRLRFINPEKEYYE